MKDREASNKLLNNKERFDLLLRDLEFLFQFEEIEASQLITILNKLETEEAKEYISNLFTGSKPESALRESFFITNSPLTKFLFSFSRSAPEVVENGFVDYLIKDEMGHTIILELKSLFYSEKEKNNAGVIIVKKIKQRILDWSNHKTQIKSYISKGDYVVLTNLKEWVFFNRSLNPKKLEPFLIMPFREFTVDYENYGKNFKEFCDRKEYQKIRYILDKEFRSSLSLWVKKFSEIEFKTDAKTKLELIIGLINKFVFIQTLDDHGVITFKWINKNWKHYESQWIPKGKLTFLKEFLGSVDKWFFNYYDTELFKEDVFKYIKEENKNIELFYEALRDVLGVTYLHKHIDVKGILQYNFRLIDEDVLGKAYETFLAKVRKEEGVYYTPKNITEYVVENTVDQIFGDSFTKIKERISQEDFEGAKDLILDLRSIKVLDPACGSGSFLIKAFRIIVKYYRELNNIIENNIKKNTNYSGTLDIPRENYLKLEKLSELKKTIGPKNGRELITRILVRHILGVDLDKRALEVAKVNVWLEAVKLSPTEFRYNQLPTDTNRILPNLSMNFRCGNSLVGLPEELTINYLQKNHKNDLCHLFNLRKKYLENPVDSIILDEIEDIKRVIGNKLDKEFTEYLMLNNLPVTIVDETIILHWALDFWYLFFGDDGKPLPNKSRGVSIIIGNPPYVKAKLMNTKIREYLAGSKNKEEKQYSSTIGSYDEYVVFIEKSIQLLKNEGHFGFINPNKFVYTDYGKGIRKIIKNDVRISQFIDFGDAQVFEEATNYTCLLFLQKIKEENYKFFVGKVKDRTTDLVMFIEDMQKNFKIFNEIKRHDYELFLCSSSNLTADNWRLITSSQQQLLKKITNNNECLEDLTYKIFVGLQITPIEVFALQLKQSMGKFARVIPIKPEDNKEEYIIESELLVPILKSSNIERYFAYAENYYVIFPYDYVGKKDQEFDSAFIEEEEMKRKYPKTLEYLNKKRHFLEKREKSRWKDSPKWYEYSRAQNFGCHPLLKIITPGISICANYAMDEKAYFIDRGSYGIILRDGVPISYKYLLALLNSKLLDFFLQYTAPFISGGYYSYQTKYLNALPIRKAKTNEQLEIEKIVDRVQILKKAHYKLLDFWKGWCLGLKTNEYSLLRILTDDLKSVRSGEIQNAWTSKVTYYPTEVSNPERAFRDFKIIGESDKNILTIHGLTDKTEEPIYTIEFDNRNLMLHFYCVLLETLRSRAEIETLSQLFSKTLVPIIKEVNKNSKDLTSNTILRARNEFNKWLEEEKIETLPADIVKIQNETLDAEANIDAIVFALYGMNQPEIEVILDSLKTSPVQQSRILEYLKNGGQ